MIGQDQNTPILSPELCRAARGLLDWTQSDLAHAAEVSRSTIRDFEGHRHEIHRATSAQLRRAFEENAVVFVSIDDVGPGVCLKSR
jgi:DNA-binding XRE family transcriptional regulator